MTLYAAAHNLAALPIRQNVLFMSSTTLATFGTALGGLDVTATRRLAMRVGQRTEGGFDWVTVRVRLVDGSNAEATVTVWDHVTQTGVLPDFAPLEPNVYDRMFDLEIGLDEFPGVDLTNLARIEIVLESDGAPFITRQFHLDDLRFE